MFVSKSVHRYESELTMARCDGLPLPNHGKEPSRLPLFVSESVHRYESELTMARCDGYFP